jgi:hypothetical protein
MGTIAVTDPNIQYVGGPFGGASGNGLSWIVGAGGATLACPGTMRFSLNVTGANETPTLNFSTGQNLSLLKIIVDNLTPTGTNGLQNIFNMTSLALPTVTTGVHIYTVELAACNYGLWSNALTSQPLNITSISTANGSLTTAVSGFNPGLCLVMGDSRTVGANLLGDNTQDWSISPARCIADAFGWECALHAYPGLGFMVPTTGGGSSNVPGLFVAGSPSSSSWNDILAGQARVWPSGLNCVLVLGVGANDSLHDFAPSPTVSPTTLATNVQGLCAALRGVVPANCSIVINPSFAAAVSNDSSVDGVFTVASLQQSIINGVNQYIAASGDPLTFGVSTGLNSAELAYAYNGAVGTGAPSTTYWTADGIHDLLLAVGFISSRTAVNMARAFNPVARLGWSGGFTT